MPARPAYVWSGTEWVPIGPPAPTSPFYYQASAPSTPSIGDVWIDSDETAVPLNSGDYLTKAEASAFFKHYEYTATAGQTTFTGADNSSTILSYTVGAITVFLNGVLLQPGDDYTATNGTSIVLQSAAGLGDAIAVVAFTTFSLANTYSQSEINQKFAGRVQATAPATPATGDIWLKSDTKESYIYSGTEWVASGLQPDNEQVVIAMRIFA